MSAKATIPVLMADNSFCMVSKSHRKQLITIVGSYKTLVESVEKSMQMRDTISQMRRPGNAPGFRFLILFCAVCMQLCLGATYSWSVYVQPLRGATGLSQGLVQVPFTIFYFVFPATLFFASDFLTRWGPRRSAITGGLLFGGGWIVAGQGGSHFVVTSLGIGLLAGAGAGLAYIVPIAVCMQWFPRQKGLVTGIAVAGFGGGAALVTQVAGRLMHDQGVSVYATLTVCGAAFLVLISLSGFFMRFPDPSQQTASAPVRLGDVVQHGSFRLLYVAMLIGLAAGFAVNANLKEIQPQPDLQTGLMAVSLFALANAVGRIVWGAVYDRHDPAWIIQLNLLFQAAVLLFLPWLLHERWAMLLFALLTGFNYGGVLVIYAGSVGHVWGTDQVGRIYGWLFSANIPAALAPILAGFCFDLTGSFQPALTVLGLALISGALLTRIKRYLLASSDA